MFARKLAGFESTYYCHTLTTKCASLCVCVYVCGKKCNPKREAIWPLLVRSGGPVPKHTARYWIKGQGKDITNWNLICLSQEREVGVYFGRASVRALPVAKLQLRRKADGFDLECPRVSNENFTLLNSSGDSGLSLLRRTQMGTAFLLLADQKHTKAVSLPPSTTQLRFFSLSFLDPTHHSSANFSCMWIPVPAS